MGKAVESAATIRHAVRLLPQVAVSLWWCPRHWPNSFTVLLGAESYAHLFPRSLLSMVEKNKAAIIKADFSAAELRILTLFPFFRHPDGTCVQTADVLEGIRVCVLIFNLSLQACPHPPLWESKTLHCPAALTLTHPKACLETFNDLAHFLCFRAKISPDIFTSISKSKSLCFLLNSDSI